MEDFEYPGSIHLVLEYANFIEVNTQLKIILERYVYWKFHAIQNYSAILIWDFRPQILNRM